MLPDRFLFTGPVPDDELAAYYRNAHAYVSLSEHEGFCVPLIEAMAMDVPVLAYAAAAVPETLGGAGVSFAPKDLEQAAELLGALIYDEPFRQGVLEGQRRAGTRLRSRPRGAVDSANAGDRDIVRIAFIVQRYGTEIIGGAEYLCRLVAERLAARHQVDVLTTCARDYVTWANEYPEGADRLRGVTVRRFAVARTRDIAVLQPPVGLCFRRSTRRRTRWSGSSNRARGRRGWSITSNAISTSTTCSCSLPTSMRRPCWASRSHRPSPSSCPWLHDEAPARLDLPGGVRECRGYRLEHGGRTPARLVAFPLAHAGGGRHRMRRGPAGGRGHRRRRPEVPPVTADGREPFAPHIEGPANAFRRRHRMHEPFVLYGGRIDPGKGCEELLEYFQTYIKEGGDTTLMLMGVKLMPLPDDPHVRFAGMLPDEERLHALEAASVVIVPSPHESLSLLALEAMAVGTPVLANARSEVLVEHCRQSNAGLYYADRWEFVEALRLLMRDGQLRAAMGRNGRAYINRHYRWSSILRKYERLFARLAAPGANQTPGPRAPPRARARPRPRTRPRRRSEPAPRA